MHRWPETPPACIQNAWTALKRISARTWARKLSITDHHPERGLAARKTRVFHKMKEDNNIIFCPIMQRELQTLFEVENPRPSALQHSRTTQGMPNLFRCTICAQNQRLTSKIVMWTVGIWNSKKVENRIRCPRPDCPDLNCTLCTSWQMLLNIYLNTALRRSTHRGTHITEGT